MTDTTGSLSNLAALLLAVGLAAAIAVDVRRDVRRLVRGRNVVLLGIFIWYLLEAIGGLAGLEEYDQRRYNFGVFCVALAAAAFLAAYHASAPRAFEGLGARLSQLDRPDLLWKIVLTGAVIGFAPLLYFSGGDIVSLVKESFNLRKGPLSLGRGRYGGGREALLELQMFIKGVAPFAVLLLVHRSSTPLQRLVCVATIAWPILRAYGSGTRHTLFLALVPILAAVYWKSSPARQRQLLVLATIPLALIAFKFSAAMAASRNSGEFSWAAAERADYVGHEMFRELLFISSKVPEEAPYQRGYGYYVQAVNPIPRALWPGKPVLESGILLAQLYGSTDEKSGDVFMTRSPGILGEMYLNFGLLGIVVLSAAGGWLLRAWDLLADRHADAPAAMVVYSLGLAVVFFLGRSLNLPVCYGLLSLLALVFVLADRPAPAPAWRCSRAAEND